MLNHAGVLDESIFSSQAQSQLYIANCSVRLAMHQQVGEGARLPYGHLLLNSEHPTFFRGSRSRLATVGTRGALNVTFCLP